MSLFASSSPKYDYNSDETADKEAVPSSNGLKKDKNSFFSSNSGSESDQSLQSTSCREPNFKTVIASLNDSDNEQQLSPVLKRFPVKRQRLLSENSNEVDESEKVSASTLNKSNIYQLSSSSDDDESATTNSASVSAGHFYKQNNQAIPSGKYVIPISRRLLAGPRSNADPVKYSSLGKSSSTGKRKHKNKHKRIKSSSLVDDDVDESYQKREFDSDFSLSDDEDVEAISSRTKEKIIALFQESSEEELSTMSQCSSKKAKVLVDMRPYKSWRDLLSKLDNTKSLNRNMVWSGVDLLHKRKTLCMLMDECSQISKKLEAEFDRLQDGTTQSPKQFCKDIVVQQQPSNLTATSTLKPYQMIGLNWLVLLHRNSVNGILADEMGLGKTIQTISFLAYLQSEGISDGPHLIIVPSSTLDNWIREFSQWCPSMNVVLYNGKQDERKSLRHQLLRGYIDCNVILTTYNLAISVPEDRNLFKKLNMDYAIFDEGHMLKNMSTQRFQHLMKLNVKHRLLLTGTPLQNNLLELMSLLRFVMPHMFKESTSSLVRIFSHSSNDNASAFAKQRINHAKLIMQPFVLRRLKQDVLHQLPKKLETIHKCDLTPAQKTLYEKVKAKFKNKVFGQSLPKSELKNVFVELRKVANHPVLHRDHYPDSVLRKMAKLLKEDVVYAESNETYLFEDMQVMHDFELHKLCLSSNAIKKYKLSDNILMDSGKFEQLDILLPKFKSEGRRILIFSQFTMMMDVLEVYLKMRQHTFLRLDGQTPVNDRLDIIDKFNNDTSYFVFVLSTKAGGLGINLTAASVVILHDIDSNPYNDKQAEDRCHRLGQLKDVQVFKLISKHTVEESMYQCAQYKLRLEKDMTEGDDDTVDMAALITQSLE